MTTGREHWESIYKTKDSDQMSWTQDIPKTSLDFIRSFGLTKNASIIDVGGGDSKLVDFLLDKGYENITVLDISEKALKKAVMFDLEEELKDINKRIGEKKRTDTQIYKSLLEERRDCIDRIASVCAEFKGAL